MGGPGTRSKLAARTEILFDSARDLCLQVTFTVPTPSRRFPASFLCTGRPIRAAHAIQAQLWGPLHDPALKHSQSLPRPGIHAPFFPPPASQIRPHARFRFQILWRPPRISLSIARPTVQPFTCRMPQPAPVFP